MNGIHEARGSIPLSSTNVPKKIGGLSVPDFFLGTVACKRQEHAASSPIDRQPHARPAVCTAGIQKNASSPPLSPRSVFLPGLCQPSMASPVEKTVLLVGYISNGEDDSQDGGEINADEYIMKRHGNRSLSMFHK